MRSIMFQVSLIALMLMTPFTNAQEKSNSIERDVEIKVTSFSREQCDNLDLSCASNNSQGSSGFGEILVIGGAGAVGALIYGLIEAPDKVWNGVKTVAEGIWEGVQWVGERFVDLGKGVACVFTFGIVCGSDDINALRELLDKNIPTLEDARNANKAMSDELNNAQQRRSDAMRSIQQLITDATLTTAASNIEFLGTALDDLAHNAVARYNEEIKHLDNRIMGTWETLPSPDPSLNQQPELDAATHESLEFDTPKDTPGWLMLADAQRYKRSAEQFFHADLGAGEKNGLLEITTLAIRMADISYAAGDSNIGDNSLVVANSLVDAVLSPNIPPSDQLTTFVHGLSKGAFGASYRPIERYKSYFEIGEALGSALIFQHDNDGTLLSNMALAQIVQGIEEFSDHFSEKAAMLDVTLTALKAFANSQSKSAIAVLGLLGRLSAATADPSFNDEMKKDLMQRTQQLVEQWTFDYSEQGQGIGELFEQIYDYADLALGAKDVIKAASSMANLKYEKVRELLETVKSHWDEWTATSTTRRVLNATESGTLIGSSPSSFRGQAERFIREANDNHPLKFLLDERGKFRPSRGFDHEFYLHNPDIIQMGHVISRKSGEQEFIVLQTAWRNQFDNVTVEGAFGRGSYVQNVVLDIGGIGVEFRSAADWVDAGLIDERVFLNAPRIVLE